MRKKRFPAAAISLIGGLALARSFYETRNLKAARYKISSEKIPENKKIKIAFLSDLHGCTFGAQNKDLERMVKKEKPDLILIGGDMYTAGNKKKDAEVSALVRQLARIAPVYYAMGNHEEYLRTQPKRYGKRFENICRNLSKSGIMLLNNKHADAGNNISVYGLEISRRYYARFNKKSPGLGQMQRSLGKADCGRYNILLAHSPAFAESYEKWKPDLVLCGHYHGGIIGLPDIKKRGVKRGVISPDLKIFPDRCEGTFRINETDFIVSAGCGSHGLNFRLFNRPEVVFIELSSKTQLV